jgi:hypothetical protein
MASKRIYIIDHNIDKDTWDNAIVAYDPDMKCELPGAWSMLPISLSPNTSINLPVDIVMNSIARVKCGMYTKPLDVDSEYKLYIRSETATINHIPGYEGIYNKFDLRNGKNGKTGWIRVDY